MLVDGVSCEVIVSGGIGEDCDAAWIVHSTRGGDEEGRAETEVWIETEDGSTWGAG